MLITSFCLIPAAQLFKFTYDVNSYYSAIMKDKMPEEPLQQQTCLAVFRSDNTMWRMELDTQEYALLLCLSRGKTLQEALDEVSVNNPQNLKDWFARWMQHGLLSKAEVHTDIKETRDAHVAA